MIILFSKIFLYALFLKVMHFFQLILSDEKLCGLEEIAFNEISQTYYIQCVTEFLVHLWALSE